MEISVLNKASLSSHLLYVYFPIYERIYKRSFTHVDAATKNARGMLFPQAWPHLFKKLKLKQWKWLSSHIDKVISEGNREEGGEEFVRPQGLRSAMAATVN